MHASITLKDGNQSLFLIGVLVLLDYFSCVLGLSYMQFYYTYFGCMCICVCVCVCGGFMIASFTLIASFSFSKPM